MSVKYIPVRGDIVWLCFDPQAGHEQSGYRPAVVVSPAAYNGKTGLMICCPMTTQIKGYPFEVLVEGSAINGAILSDQVKSLNWQAREAEKKGRVSKETLQELLDKLNMLLS